MAHDTRPPDELELGGISGANPLGFLAGLGALVTLRNGGEPDARLRWCRPGTWVPVLEGVSAAAPAALSEVIVLGLRGHDVPDTAEAKRREAEARRDAAERAVREMRREIRARGLSQSERQAAVEAELRPLEATFQRARAAWLQALAAAVPRPELALGKRLDCTGEEYRHHAAALLAKSGAGNRDGLDLLVAFGSDGCLQPRSDTIEPTPFQFITGSGHQYFLETVRQLMDKVSAKRVERTLFEAWMYPDEGLSMRWDPVEDRRYALMDRDPTASDNKSRTMWMANLLAYRALAVLPCAPRNQGLATVGWTQWDGEGTLTWPIWEPALSPDTIRSLLALPELTAANLDRSALRARGVVAVFRARRVKVGSGANYKLNFSPARECLGTGMPFARLRAAPPRTERDSKEPT